MDRRTRPHRRIAGISGVIIIISLYLIDKWTGLDLHSLFLE